MTSIVAFLLLLGQPTGGPPDLATARQWFEAGRHADVAAIPVGDQTPPAVIYLVAQSHERLNRSAPARAAQERLATRPPTDPWHFIGQSAMLLADGQTAQALSAAEQAVSLGPRVPEAQFQLGHVYAGQRNYGKAATAFEAAVAIDPGPAYAHYYAGFSYYQAERIDLMARYFESFLKLAPAAPERPQVESIMRTVRGRR